ncbi:MAG: nicotinate phosphoribosyltransferase, partial [Cyclobacteriaceae bacterium]|nr:nicotinate phosphoribosyltransferase [Cyclobacteriaceae bacterium]
KIVASNDLDEYILESLHDQHAKLDLLGIGTKLVTAYDQPALGGVYKLSALKNKNGEWESKIKLSEQAIKINIPGIQQVRRFYKDGLMVADMIYDLEIGYSDEPTIKGVNDPTKSKKIKTEQFESEDLLVPIFKEGRLIYKNPELSEIRSRVSEQLEKLHSGITRFVNPHAYVVGLEQRLYEKRMRLILEQKKLIS